MDELEIEDLFVDVQLQIWAAEGLFCVGNINIEIDLSAMNMQKERRPRFVMNFQ